ncbi:hypothetical protein D3C84_845360 [compost metagenome]
MIMPAVSEKSVMMSELWKRDMFIFSCKSGRIGTSMELPKTSTRGIDAKARYCQMLPFSLEPAFGLLDEPSS